VPDVLPIGEGVDQNGVTRDEAELSHNHADSEPLNAFPKLECHVESQGDCNDAVADHCDHAGRLLQVEPSDYTLSLQLEGLEYIRYEHNWQCLHDELDHFRICCQKSRDLVPEYEERQKGDHEGDKGDDRDNRGEAPSPCGRNLDVRLAYGIADERAAGIMEPIAAHEEHSAYKSADPLRSLVFNTNKA